MKMAIASQKWKHFNLIFALLLSILVISEGNSFIPPSRAGKVPLRASPSKKPVIPTRRHFSARHNIRRGDVVTAAAIAIVGTAAYLQTPPITDNTYGQVEDRIVQPTRHSGEVPKYDVADSDKLYASMDTERCMALLADTDIDVGISSHTAINRLAEYGVNELKSVPPPSLLSLVLEQFEDRLVKILLFVAIFSAFTSYLEREMSQNQMSSFIEPVVILAILIINAFIGVWQTKSASQALNALLNIQAASTTVLRDGIWISEYDVKHIVPGDVLKLRVGDKVPADCRIVRILTSALAVDEASLTGESTTVYKSTNEVSPDSNIMAKSSMVFSGSVITVGSAYVLVTSTGMSTEIGKISSAVQEAKHIKTKTPLALSLDHFSAVLTKAVVLICLSVWLVNIPRFSSPTFGTGYQGWLKGCLHHFKTAIALGVAAIPEGLPAVITLGLSLGTRRLAKKHVIVRNLASVETLGCTSVICTDKTGTLTTNEMTAVSLCVLSPSNKKGVAWCVEECEVDGVGYSPHGKVGLGACSTHSSSSGLCHEIAEVCTLCNDASLFVKDGEYMNSGEPTEAALLVLAEKLGNSLQDTDSVGSLSSQVKGNWRKSATLEFDRIRKSMSVLCSKQKVNKLFVKGAPDFLLKRCSKVKLPDGSIVPLSASLRQLILEKASSLGERPLRTMALAVKLPSSLPRPLRSWDGRQDDSRPKELLEPENFSKVESDLVFLGLVGIKDLARAEVSASMDKCKEAGVRVMMVTGDSKPTALAIARDVHIFTQTEYENEVSILKSSDSSVIGRTFTGAEFFGGLTEEQQVSKLREGGNLVFCRIEPLDKQRLVKMLQLKLDEVVAMTGDGVNDAAALQQASIGIAMGKSGTDVAKASADMILSDDNFASIVSAVEEGRGIFANMQAFIYFLVSCNVGELAIILTASMLGLPEPLTTIQLLWVNLVTDGPPATALAFNPVARNSMKKPPRKRDKPLISTEMLTKFIFTGAYVASSTLGVMLWWFAQHGVSLKQMMSHHLCVEGSPISSSLHLIGSDLAALGVSHENPCSIFQSSLVKSKVQTLALSVLVATEMLKALSSVSLSSSCLQVLPVRNMFLVAAVLMSFGLHLAVVNTPLLSSMFGLTPLLLSEWKVVLAFSLPVLLLEELLKLISRNRV